MRSPTTTMLRRLEAVPARAGFEVALSLPWRGRLQRHSSSASRRTAGAGVAPDTHGQCLPGKCDDRRGLRRARVGHTDGARRSALVVVSAVLGPLQVVGGCGASSATARSNPSRCCRRA
jgi:hypothetical protein